MSAIDAIPLTYAPVRPRGGWRRALRWVGVVVVVGLVGAGGTWGPEGVRRAHRLYLQRQCLTYAPAGERVVYDEDQRARLAWWKAEPRDESKRPAVAVTVEPMPAGWEKLRPMVLMPTDPNQAKWVNDPSPRACLLTHEVAWPGGERRLLVVELLSGQPVPHVVSYAVRPSTWDRPPGPQDAAIASRWTCGLGTFKEKGVSFSPNAWGTMRAYEGRVEPADPGHVIIPFDLDGVRVYLHGRAAKRVGQMSWGASESEAVLPKSLQ
ncbi:MAG TPA: hypothetical protein VEA69_26125 [Tepidisphaeraceae bacterium]|nr:hypothetical protein [Tepidisphaeraceae bacterium]